jgi:hypothetical protein
MNIDPSILAQLEPNGSPVYLDDDTRLTLIAEPDEDVSINDYDCYGRYELIDDRGRREPRPDGFDGAARKLWLPQNQGRVWWQPPEGFHQLCPDDQRKTRDAIVDLIAFGFTQFGLRLEHRIVDTAYNSAVWHRVHTEWIGGCDSFYPELVTDLAAGLPDPIGANS